MRISHTADEIAGRSNARNNTFSGALRSLADAADRPGKKPSDGGMDTPKASGDDFSSGGLDAPDGQTRDPFPPSLIAYIEILRSVAAYLRQAKADAAAGAGGVASDKIDRPKDEIDVAEPTTFAIGEEESSECGGSADVPDATTLAVGEEDGGGPIPVEPGGGIGDGAGPIPEPPEQTTLAIGEEDGGASL